MKNTLKSNRNHTSKHANKFVFDTRNRLYLKNVSCVYSMKMNVRN